MEALEILEVVDKVKADFNNLFEIHRDQRPNNELAFRIYHPFYFDDGDHLGLVLKQKDGQWVVSDEGHFFFHMGIFVDDDIIHSGECKKHVDRCRRMFDIEDHEGELISVVEDKRFGESVTDFLQFFMRAMHLELLIQPEKETANEFSTSQ